MEFYTVQYIQQAIEELEDYLPLLKHQDRLNKTLVSHSINALKQTITNYENNDNSK